MTITLEFMAVIFLRWLQPRNIVLRSFLTHDEDEHVLNDYHLGVCGGHIFAMATKQKILPPRYFWPSIFKHCIEAIKKFPPYLIF
jgi:hypothetical protein